MPRVLVVASFPFLSEAQGSGLDAFILRPAASNSNQLDRYVRSQVPGAGGYIWTTYVDPKIAEYGWFSRRLAFLLARIENPDVLTDGTTAKGSAFKGLLGGLVREEKCYAFESEWAEQIVTIDVQIQHSFGPGEHPIGWVRMRRLLVGSYRVSFENNGTQHRGSSPSSMRTNGWVSLDMTLEEERSHWVERFLWDSVRPVDQANGDRRGATIPGATLAVGQDLGNGNAKSTISFRFYEYIGTDVQGLQNDSLWKAVFSTQMDVEYRLDANRVIANDSSPGLKADIERSFSARLAAEYKTQRQQWVPVIILEPIYGTSGFGRSVVFGGDLSLHAVNPREPDGRGVEYFRSLSENWWSWSNETYSDIPAYRSASGKTEWKRFGQSRTSLRTKARFSHSLPGELNAYPSAVKNKNKLQTKIVLRMSCKYIGSSYDFGGLWGDEVYQGVLEFDIPNWTVEDIRQFIVNGIVPDHAMP